MEHRRRGRPPHPGLLTPGEQRVLEELRRGGTNADIAERLGLSRETVKTHIARMLSKLDLHTRQELAAWRPRPTDRWRRLRALLVSPAALVSLGQPTAWTAVAVVGVAGATVAAVGIAVSWPILRPAPQPIVSTVATTPPPPSTATDAAAPTTTRRATRAPAASATPSPSPAPTPTPDRVADTIDVTGAVTAAGSYSFLGEDGTGAMVPVTTYEELRDGSATLLRIRTTRADGSSRAATLGGVRAGDLVEWHAADDCFVRYQVREVKAGRPGTAARREFGVEWMTYAYTGCSGAIAPDVSATFNWGDLPDLGGDALPAPVIHGIYQIVPAGWSGGIREPTLDFSGPGQPEEFRSYSTLSEARQLPYWRDPALPEGWILESARIGFEGPRHGYCASFRTEERTWRNDEVYRNPGFELCALSITGRYHPQPALDRNGVTEARVIAGRPSVVRYGRSPGDGYPISIAVYDPETESEYTFHAADHSIRGSDPEAALEVVRGLFGGALFD